MLAEVREANIPALEGSREALRAIRHLATYSQRLASRRRRKQQGARTCAVLPQPAEVVSAILNRTDTAIGQADLFQHLAEAGLPAPAMRRVEGKAEAEQAARDLGPTVVMKIDTARVVHKSDVGGVALGVTPETAARTYDNLMACLDPPVGSYPGEGVVVPLKLRAASKSLSVPSKMKASASWWCLALAAGCSRFSIATRCSCRPSTTRTLLS